MGVLHVSVIVTAAVLWTLVKTSERQKKTDCSKITEFTITYPHVQEVTCRPCPKCPPGEGLPEECGSKVPNGTSTDCVPCKANKTYSTSNDSSTCWPCNQCRLKNVLQICTRFQNQVCGTSCPPGHFLDKRNDGCTKCFFCCDSVPELGRFEECKEINMPRNMRCERTEENENCKRLYEQSTAQPPNNTGPLKINLTTGNKHLTDANKESSGYSKVWSWPVTPLPNLGTKTTVQRDKASPSTKEKDYKTGKITLIVGLVIFATGIALKALYSKKKKAGKDKADQMRSLLEQKASLQKDHDKLTFLPSAQGLIDLPFEVEKSIKKLDCLSRGVHNWRDLGRKFEIPEADLDQIALEYQSGGSPVKSLMEILHTKYITSLQRFVSVVQEIEREDIADEICTFYKTQVLTIKTESNSTMESFV